MKHRSWMSCVVMGALALASCGDTEESDEVARPDATAEIEAMVQTYGAIVFASYEDSASSASALDQAVDALIASPSAANMEATRQAWLDAREPYLQTEVYRFYEGPIDNAEDGPEGLINAWPLDEVYIDAVEGRPTAGVINDASVEITPAMLESLNEAGGEKNIATGYHAVEFLLWGQDLSADGPGARPFTDYDPAGETPNAARRGLYLSTVSELLVGHLEGVRDAWAPGAANYRAEFEAAEPLDALARVLTGMIILSGFETGGERLQTALDSGEQEDEHSCFSDNTHRDMVQDVRGVQNVWRGSYTRLDGTKIEGTGVRAVVMAVDPELAGELDAQIDASLELAEALQPPFDREIRSDNPAGRKRVQDLVISLHAQEGLLQEVFRAFNLDIPEAE
jgi:putative iron-regulated protein